MKAKIFIIIAIIFSACGGLDEDDSGTLTGTLAEFKNLDQFPVTIYSDSARHQALTEIAAGSSKKVPVTPSADRVYYPTFRINVPDIEGESIPYNGPPIPTAIIENETTLVPIPKLESVSINKTYLKLINDSDFSITLWGGYERPPLGDKPSIVTPGKTAAYEIIPGPSSAYSVMHNTATPVAFPASIPEFEKGKVYIFTYSNGTNLSLKAIWPIPSPGWPSAPGNVRAEVISGNRVQLSWDTIYDATSYRVYRATGPATASYSQLVVTAAPSYTNTVVSNQTYHYIIIAVKDNKEGEKSNVVSVSTIEPPGGVWVFAKTHASVLLAWNDIGGATGYNIYRSDTQTGDYVKVGTAPTNPPQRTVCADTGLSADTVYYYKVSATLNGTEGGQSDPISVTTLPPLDIWVTSSGTTGISLAWDAINGASHYAVERFDKDVFYGSSLVLNTPSGFTPTHSTQYTDTNVSPYMTYNYSIRVFFPRSSGTSYWGIPSGLEISATAGD